MERPESCPSCGRYTERGKQQLREQSKPIFGTDLSKPISELLSGIRNEMTRLRGQLSDIGYRYSGYEERLDSLTGLLTCGIVALHYEIEEIKKIEDQREHEAGSQSQ